MKKILVVDDSQFSAHAVKSIFRQRFECFHADSGQKAIEYLEKEKPDLILMDILMPGMDGVEAFKCLRKNPKTRDIPVIFVTSVANPEVEAQCLEMGAKDFIHKPINASVLLARINNVLGE